MKYLLFLFIICPIFLFSNSANDKLGEESQLAQLKADAEEAQFPTAKEAYKRSIRDGEIATRTNFYNDIWTIEDKVKKSIKEGYLGAFIPIKSIDEKIHLKIMKYFDEKGYYCGITSHSNEYGQSEYSVAIDWSGRDTAEWIGDLMPYTVKYWER